MFGRGYSEGSDDENCLIKPTQRPQSVRGALRVVTEGSNLKCYVSEIAGRIGIPEQVIRMARWYLVRLYDSRQVDLVSKAYLYIKGCPMSTVHTPKDTLEEHVACLLMAIKIESRDIHAPSNCCYLLTKIMGQEYRFEGRNLKKNPELAQSIGRWQKFLIVEAKILKELNYRLIVLEPDDGELEEGEIPDDRLYLHFPHGLDHPKSKSWAPTPTMSLQKGQVTTTASQSSLHAHTLIGNLTMHPQQSAWPQQAITLGTKQQLFRIESSIQNGW